MAYEDKREELEELTAGLVANASFTAEQISEAARCAYMEVTSYTRRQELDTELIAIAAQIAVIKLNRLGTEGAASLGFSGVTENYIDGYPSHIKYILNSKRKLKVL